jgi:DNA-binding response OmpR family regulator
MLMRNAGRTIEFRVLFRAVWGDEDPGDYATLKTHILRLRRKIEDDPHDPRYIRTVRGVGYVFDRNPTTGTHRGKADATGAPNSLPG